MRRMKVRNMRGLPTSASALADRQEVIRKDAADPDYASMLRTVGVVQVPDAARRVDLKGNVDIPKKDSLHDVG